MMLYSLRHLSRVLGCQRGRGGAGMRPLPPTSLSVGGARHWQLETLMDCDWGSFESGE